MSTMVDPGPLTMVGLAMASVNPVSVQKIEHPGLMGVGWDTSAVIFKKDSLFED
jgi:hypothetical protein